MQSRSILAPGGAEMTKTQLFKANEIYLRTIELLLERVESYEKMMETCVVMPKEHYNELLDMVKGNGQ